ncbi:MAG: hypothetical protein EOS18_11295 [Mesorhizobium sp.]|nr:MAG: hypothetical protein EOS18_11295 [Mesorhizobium sp.]
MDKSATYQGVPIDPTHLPTKKVGGGKIMPADLMMHNSFFVSGKFREVVEKLEPGLHQFVPVELLWKDGSHAASYFCFTHATASTAWIESKRRMSSAKSRDSG